MEVGAVTTLEGGELPRPRHSPLRSTARMDIVFAGAGFGRSGKEAAEPAATCDGSSIADASNYGAKAGLSADSRKKGAAEGSVIMIPASWITEQVGSPKNQIIN